MTALRQAVSRVRLLTLSVDCEFFFGFFCMAGRQAESDNRVQRPSVLPRLYEQFMQKFLKKSVIICSALVFFLELRNDFFSSH